MAKIRSLLFSLAYYMTNFAAVLIAVVLMLVPARRPLAVLVRTWARLQVFWMRVLAGIGIDFRGLEHAPSGGAALMASKHQSWADGILVVSQVPDVATIAMKELLAYPIAGTVLKRLQMIMVDTCGGSDVADDMNKRARLARRQNRPILIYPEGRLVPIGETARYKAGIYHLYNDLKLPVVPIATNIGLRWPCRSFWKSPGPAVLEFLTPIQPGLDRDAFMGKLEQTIEEATVRLIAEGLS